LRIERKKGGEGGPHPRAPMVVKREEGGMVLMEK